MGIGYGGWWGEESRGRGSWMGGDEFEGEFSLVILVWTDLPRAMAHTRVDGFRNVDGCRMQDCSSN